MAPNWIGARAVLGADAQIVVERQHGGVPAAAQSTAAASNTSLIIGIAVGVPVVLAIAIAIVIARILRLRRAHRRALAELEQRAGAATRGQMQEVPRPVSSGRTGRLASSHAQGGWDMLGSNDTVNEPEQVANPKRKRSTVSLPKRIRQSKDIQLKRWKHLSAIVESPRSESRKSSAQPSIHAMPPAENAMPSPHHSSIGQATTTDQAVMLHPDQSVIGCSGSPKPEVLPSFAFRSPARSGAAIANDEPKRMGMRSASVGALNADGAVFSHTEQIIRNPRRNRPPLHERSISLGAPLTRPPSGPVPPLPVISPHTITNDECSRQGVCVSRMSSSSSINSAGSSVLITSPILARTDDQGLLSTPTLEDVVADDENAALKNVTNRQWQRPRVAGPRAGSSNSMRVEKSRASVRANIVRFSSESLLSRQLSTASTASSDSGRNGLSVPHIATADSISIRRVSSSNSLRDSGSAVKKITTPTRRPSRRRVSSVSHSGSPAERKRNNVLRDISGNATKPAPQRQVSISTQDSGRSSNGNPFQWDCSPSRNLTKPSALKGSPNARKGQRRQNCVRISTLTPQILGPASTSRSSSPAGIMMDGIIEERESDEYKRGEYREIERVVANERRRTRPPMPSRTTSSESNLRIQTLRASLTPSSPTLSTWNAYQEAHGFPMQHSDSNLSVAHSNFSMSPINSHRSGSRQSSHSGFVIPTFPSPTKARASVAVSQIDTAPMPQFSFDMESPTLGFGDPSSCSPWALPQESTPASPHGDSPVDLSPTSPIDLPSSPPLPISKTKEYDPAWPMASLPTLGAEYDPASPPVVWDNDATEPERSSGFFLPFAAVVANQDADVSPRNRLDGYAQNDDEPSCLLKTVSQPVFDEKLTSANASSIMARMPESQPGTSSFLGTNVPILIPPTTGYEDLYQTHWQSSPIVPHSTLHHRNRSVSISTPVTPGTTVRTTTARPPPLPTIPQSDDSPPEAPPQTTKPAGKTSPRGPRSAPAKSVLKNAMALRRMNSEISSYSPSNRESRAYARLGREASPLLPWIGTPTETVPHDNELFDFDFDATTGGAEQARRAGNESPSALDDLDLEAFGRNIDGALAEFEAEFEANLGYARLSAVGDGHRHRQHHHHDLSRAEKANSPGLSGQEAQRSSNVWDDGERYWSGGIPCSEKKTSPPKKERGWEREEDSRTVDPRLLLSTPVARLKQSSQQQTTRAVCGTPESLYGADGFLKA
ncbi:Hypothetical predicted protein [Lecanosticta acicola]|uniref:Uncharacterized protein n=1 Tax=Lecanosticta acicola TaxID=111012 RepID=A0AAI8YZ19_9PEZI|nr:Hypothetical predicted protein [Lecanosticta acicola]